MALIGVTFATFAGQSLINNRNFSQSVNFPTSEQFDGLRPGAAHQRHEQPALGDPRAQPASRHVRQRLADDRQHRLIQRPAHRQLPTGGPLSDPKRPLLGALAKPAPQRPDRPYPGPDEHPGDLRPCCPRPLYGADFTRWILRIRSVPLSTTPFTTSVITTYEVLDDDPGTSQFAAGFHTLTLSPVEAVHGNSNGGILGSFVGDTTQTGPLTRILNNPNLTGGPGHRRDSHLHPPW